MTDRQVSIRIGVTGKEDVKRAFDEVGKAGQDAFARVGTAMDSAGAAADREAQRLQRLAQAARQAAAADAAQQNFNRVLGVGTSNAGSARDSAKVFMDAAKATEDLEARTKALRAQIDPLGAAQGRLNAELAEANALFRAGAITAQEQAAAHALAQTRFNGTAKALGAVGASTRLTNAQLVNLSYQFNDVVVSLAGGQPLQVPAGLRMPFVWVRARGNRAFISGHVAVNADGSLARPLGKVGAEVSPEEGYASARLVALAHLASLKRALGDLDRVTAWLRVFAMVNVAPGFNQTPLVTNGYSDLILDLYGPQVGAHARSSIGMMIPLNAPVNCEAEVEIDDQ